MEIVWLYPILERYFVSIPTEYWALKGGVPDDVLIKTSTWLPSSQTDPPPEIASGNRVNVDAYLVVDIVWTTKIC